MIITLTKMEQAFARTVANERNAEVARQGFENSQQGDQPYEFITENGAQGEWAYAKGHNVYPCTNTTHPDAWDVIVPGWGKVDVKTTENENGNLVVPYGARFKMQPDQYALMIGSDGQFEYFGHILATIVIQEENVRDLGHGKCYFWPRDRLVYR